MGLSQCKSPSFKDTFVFDWGFQAEVDQGRDARQPVFLEQIHVVHLDDADSELVALGVNLLQPLQSSSALVVLVD